MARGETLIIHHVEPMWEAGFDRAYLLGVIRHLRASSYDRVIFSTIEESHPDHLVGLSNWFGEEFARIAEALRGHRVTNVPWTFSWDGTIPDLANRYGLPEADFFELERGDGIGYLYPWMRALPRTGVRLAGGYRWECLAGLMEGLDRIGIKYRAIEHLVY